MNAAAPIHPDPNHGLTAYLRGLRDPVAWAGIHFPTLRLDDWQKRALRAVGNPTSTSLHCWWTSRQMGKSQSQGLLSAWWIDTKIPIRVTRIPGSEPLREVTALPPTAAIFAQGVRAAERTLGYARDFLTAANIDFHQASSDRIVTASGAKALALPASSTARGETVQLALIDEAGHLPQGGEDIAGIVFPMQASFAMESVATVLASTPGVPQGLFYQCCRQEVPCHLITASVSENPRLSSDFLRQQRSLLSDLYFASEFCPIDPATGEMLPHLPPQFWEDGRGLFSMASLRAAVTDEAEALNIPGAWG